MRARLHLFGSPVLRDDGDQVIRLPSRKAMALLAFVAMHGGRHVARATLADLLWCDRPESLARQNLRKELSRLKLTLAEAGIRGLEISNDDVSVSPTWLETDALTFKDLILSGTDDELAAAGELYRSEFMTGFFVNAEVFDDWQAVEREILHEDAVSLFIRFARACHEAGIQTKAISAARRALEISPCQDEAIDVLISAYVAAGRPSDAVRAYNRFVDHLRSELGVQPSAAFRSKWRSLIESHVTDQVAPQFAPANCGHADAPMNGAPRIVVMPVSCEGGYGQGSAFGENLADRITGELSRFKLVRAETWAPGRSSDGDDCKYGFSLGGKLEIEADQARYTAFLEDGPQRFWIDRFRLDLRNTFDLGFEIARRVAARVPYVARDRHRKYLISLSTEKGGAEQLAAHAIELIRAGVLVHDQGRVRDGLSKAEQALERDPECYLALVALAWGNTHMANLLLPSNSDFVGAAASASDRMLEIAPDNHVAHFRKGWTHFANGDYASADSCFRQSLWLNPHDSLVRASYGTVQAVDGAAAQAKANAVEAIKPAPNNPEIIWAYHTMQIACFQMDEPELGVQWAARIGNRGTSIPTVLTALTANSMAAGKREQAAMAFQRLEQLVPHYPESFFQGHRRPFSDDADNDRIVRYLDAAQRAV